MMERRSRRVLADLAETVKIARPDRGPVHELDAQLEGAPGAAQEFIFVDAEEHLCGIVSYIDVLRRLT